MRHRDRVKARRAARKLGQVVPSARPKLTAAERYWASFSEVQQQASLVDDYTRVKMREDGFAKQPPLQDHFDERARRPRQ